MPFILYVSCAKALGMSMAVDQCCNDHTVVGQAILSSLHLCAGSSDARMCSFHGHVFGSCFAYCYSVTVEVLFTDVMPSTHMLTAQTVCYPSLYDTAIQAALCYLHAGIKNDLCTKINHADWHSRRFSACVCQRVEILLLLCTHA